MKHEMRSLSLRLLIAVGASTGVAQASEPYQLTPVQGRVLDGGHIYYNALTGERVVTVYSTDGQTAPADTGNSVPVWQAQSGPNCPGQGGTGFFFGVDDPTGGTSLSSNIIAVRTPWWTAFRSTGLRLIRTSGPTAATLTMAWLVLRSSRASGWSGMRRMGVPLMYRPGCPS